MMNKLRQTILIVLVARSGDKVSVGSIMFACPFGEYMLCVQTRRDVYNLKARVNAYIQNPEPTATSYWITFGISFTTPR
jgi:hypothetical protein